MLNIDAALEKEGLDAQMVLQIHDELLFECKEEDAQAVRDIVIDAMENVWELDVPLVVDAGIGKSWGDAKQ